MRLSPRCLFTALIALSSLFLSHPPAGAASEESAANSQDGEQQLRLSYAEKFTETPGLYDTILKQPLISALGIRQAELLQAYDAVEKPLQHRQGAAREMEGAHAAKVLEGSSDSIMLWGPYADLAAGHYVVVYRFKLSPDPTPVGTIFLDICHNACTRSGLKLEAAKQPAGQWQEIAVPLDLPDTMKLEFRFWPDGNTAAVDRIYLFKVTPKAAGQPAAADEELPEGRRVQGRTDVVRSPHTDDDGMIDISGLAKGTKVRCPYTGKFFRVP